MTDYTPWFPGDNGPTPAPEPVSRETFNFGDSPIVLAFESDNVFIEFGPDGWEVPAADLINLLHGLDRLGYGHELP